MDQADMQRLITNRDWRMFLEHAYWMLRGAQRDATKMDAEKREFLSGVATGMEMLLSAPYQLAGRDLPLPMIEQQGLQGFLALPVRRGPRHHPAPEPVETLDDWIRRAEEQGRASDAV